MVQKTLLGLLFCAVSFAQQVPRPALAWNPLLECKGKTTLLAFVVTTCLHCKAFTRDVMEPMRKRGEVCAIAVAFDEGGDTAKFVHDQGLTFTVFKLERAKVREFLGITGPDRVIGTPQVVVIDKHGTIQAQSAPQGSPLLNQPDVIRQIVEAVK